MKFEMWSIWHFLYMCSPFLIFFVLYYFIRKRSMRVKYIVGCVLGSLSVLSLLVRNVDIFVRTGWDLEVIPLQVCHLGSLVAGFALIFKKKWLILTSFCFHMIPAFLAMLFADALANYDTVFKIRAQAYVWGHILIIVCSLYGLTLFCPKFTKTDLYKALIFILIMSLLAILCNSLFRAWFSWEPNYFYLFSYKGTPLKFLYTVVPTSVYGWFEINWVYTVVLMIVFTGAFIGLYYLAKWISHICANEKVNSLS